MIEQEAPTYAERLPPAAARRWVRTCWIQTTGSSPVVQRHLPTGGAELRMHLGTSAVLVAPSTSAELETIPAGRTVLGIRFRPGVPTSALAPILRAKAGDGGPIGGARSELVRLLDATVRVLAGSADLDPLVAHAAERLMPWPGAAVAAVADEHGLSSSQLRRRFDAAIGMSPKVLQRILRLQGYVALAQAAATDPAARRRVTDLAALAGYADQPHLTRECMRLTGTTPVGLLGGEHVCGCGHDHAASFRPFLRLGLAAMGGADARSVQASRAAPP